MSSIDFDDEMAAPKAGPKSRQQSQLQQATQPAQPQGSQALVVRDTANEVALFAAQASRIGSTIDLRQNRTVTVMAWLTLAVIVSLFLALRFAHFSRTESVRGLIASSLGSERLDAPRNGVIKEIYVKQGDTVHPGTAIYQIAMSDATSSAGESVVASEGRALTQQRANQVAEMQRAEAFLKGANEQQAAVEREQKKVVAALDEQEKGMQELVDEAKAKVAHMREMVAKGYATQVQLDEYLRSKAEYERQLIEVRVRRVEQTRQETEKKREFQILLAEKESQRVNAGSQIAAIDARLTGLKTQSSMVVQSQSEGQVLSVNVTIGDSVEPGQHVALIGSPKAEALIVLDVPSRAIGLVKVGQSVVLKYDAFPYKTFGIQHGRVTSVAQAAVSGPGGAKPDLGSLASLGGAALGAAAAGGIGAVKQSVYRVEVKPEKNEIMAYGEKRRLTLGSTLSAEIIVERRRLIDWVLDPVRAMGGRG
ncbi:MAG: HlyD family efflux transporter periplasmic adaptor subunit [Alphaproteobacteria bacterium]|nr:HlyD family efflux transporter periplasmic adaptor subunit [Alphaproteobacteria bacterium]